MLSDLSESSLRRLLLGCAVLAAMGLAIPFVTRSKSEWDDVYRSAGARLLAGDNLYPPKTGYSYPPFSALMAVPFAMVDVRSSRALWYCINVVSMFAVITFAWRLACGRVPMVRKPLIFWLGMSVGLPFILHTLAHQQTDGLVAALLLGGCWAISRDRWLWGACCLGIAAAMKCTPLLFAPYLLLKGRPLAACVVFGVAIGLNLAPDLFSHPVGFQLYLEQWSRIYLLPMTQPDRPPGIWASEIIYNQAILGAANRWFGESMPARELKVWILAVFAGLALFGIVAMRRSRQQPNGIVWECAIVLAGMLLFSPMSSTPHFITMLLPAWLLAHAVVEERQRRLIPFLILIIAGAIASNKDLLGASLYSQGLWMGSVMICAIAAFVGSAFRLLVPIHQPNEAAIHDVPLRRAA